MPVTRDDVLEWIKTCVKVLAENRDYLIQLDAAIGDADHGANMDRGFQAVLKKLPEMSDKDIGAIFKAVGMTLLSTVGGAGGPLYGTFFIQAGTKTSGMMELTLDDWCNALDAAVNGVIMRGKAELGDKTMVDALVPAVKALKECSRELQAALVPETPHDLGTMGRALRLSADAAKQGMEATTPLVARKGRASYLGERSAGHQDPGATSSYLLLNAAAETWADR